jgi:hypothetical protein
MMHSRRHAEMIRRRYAQVVVLWDQWLEFVWNLIGHHNIYFEIL